MSWDRIFQKQSTPENTKIPDLTPEQAADFRLQAEERVSREKHIEREATYRNDADIALREEMHSFGMIRCEYFDPETKIIELKFANDQPFSVPARKFPHDNYTDKVWSSSAVSVSGVIKEGETLTLSPRSVTRDDADFITSMTFITIVDVGGKAFRAKLIVTRPIVDVQSGKATLFLELASAYDNGNALIVPNLADSVNIAYPYHSLKFYK